MLSTRLIPWWSYYEHLKKYFYSESCLKVTVHFIPQFTLYGINILYLYMLYNYIGQVDWAHFWELVILFSKVSLSHYWSFKSVGLFNSQLLLTHFPSNIFWIMNPIAFVGPIFQALFEATTITTNFLKSHICKTFCIKTNTLFTIFNNKE